MDSILDEIRRTYRSIMSRDAPDNEAPDAFASAMLRVAEVIEEHAE